MFAIGASDGAPPLVRAAGGITMPMEGECVVLARRPEEIHEVIAPTASMSTTMTVSRDPKPIDLMRRLTIGGLDCPYRCRCYYKPSDPDARTRHLGTVPGFHCVPTATSLVLSG